MNRRSFIKTSVGMIGTTFVVTSLLSCEKHPYLKFITGSISGSLTGSNFDYTGSYYPSL